MLHGLGIEMHSFGKTVRDEKVKAVEKALHDLQAYLANESGEVYIYPGHKLARTEDDLAVLRNEIDIQSMHFKTELGKLKEELELANSMLNKSDKTDRELRDATHRWEKSYREVSEKLVKANEAVECVNREYLRESKRRIQVEETMTGLQGELEIANAQLREIRTKTGYLDHIEVGKCLGCGEWVPKSEFEQHFHKAN